VSILASMYVLHQYKTHRALRRHPATLIIQRSIADLVFCSVLVTAAIPGAHNLLERNACGFCAFVLQTAALAAELSMFMMSIDLVVSISNPFANYKKNNRIFHATIVLVSLLSSTLLVAQGPGDACTKCPGYGPDNPLSVCWINSAGASLDEGTVNVNTIGLYFFWIGVTYSFSLFANVLAHRRLRRSQAPAPRRSAHAGYTRARAARPSAVHVRVCGVLGGGGSFLLSRV